MHNVGMKTKHETKYPVKVGFKNLELTLSLGVYEEELNKSRPILVSSFFVYNAAKACATDNLAYVVDYATLAKMWQDLAGQAHVGLLEKLASIFLDAAYSKYPFLEGCDLEIEKPGALDGLVSSFIKVQSKRCGSGWVSEVN